MASDLLEEAKKEDCVTVYKKIHEKIVVKIKLKVTRMEHLEVEVEEHEGGEWRAERAGRIADEVIEVAGQER